MRGVRYQYRYSKNIENRLGLPPSGLFAMNPIVIGKYGLNPKIIDKRFCNRFYRVRQINNPKYFTHSSLFVQPPSHLHSVLQRSPARWHLQLPLQATTQPQWRINEHALLTSSRSVQYGTHTLVLAFHSQPHSLGSGILGALERDCFQTNAAVCRARFPCWNKAC